MPLFDDGAGEPSPLGFDSLDMLDLALALLERFDLDEDRFDRMLREETELQALRTVNDIVEFVSSLSGGGGPTRSLESKAERR
jgi:acyl carrier protein